METPRIEERPAREGDACFAQDETPATIETTTSHVLVAPAKYGDDGTLITPAQYRTETTQRIVQARQPIRFRTPCPDDLTAAFMESVQRALNVRGVYDGPITGKMDALTKAAIRAYQAPIGINSTVLSLEAAQRLGLISLTPEQLEAASTGQGNPFSVPAGL